MVYMSVIHTAHKFDKHTWFMNCTSMLGFHNEHELHQDIRMPRKPRYTGVGKTVMGLQRRDQGLTACSWEILREVQLRDLERGAAERSWERCSWQIREKLQLTDQGETAADRSGGNCSWQIREKLQLTDQGETAADRSGGNCSWQIRGKLQLRDVRKPAAERPNGTAAHTSCRNCRREI